MGGGCYRSAQFYPAFSGEGKDRETLCHDWYGVKEVVHILPNGYGVFFSPEGTPFMVQFDTKMYEQLVKKYF